MMNANRPGISSLGDQGFPSVGTLVCSTDEFIELDPISDYCFIDSETSKALELAQNNVDISNRRHTLYGYLNTYTATTTGSRLLRESILKPLANYEVIEHRLNCVDHLINRVDVLASISNCIRNYGSGIDLDAVVPCLTNLSRSRTAGSLFAAEKRLDALGTLVALMTHVDPLVAALELTDQPTLNVYKVALRDSSYKEILGEISNKIEMESLAKRSKKRKLMQIRPGVDGLFDVARQTYSAALQDMEDYTRELHRKDGIPWKLSYSDSRGYYITVATSQMGKITRLDQEYIIVNRTRTMVSCTTKGLMQLNNRAKISYQNSMSLANESLADIFKYAVDRIKAIQTLVQVIGMLDLITSFAKLVINNPNTLVRPKFSATDTVLTRSKHPVLETVLRVNNLPVVPNDVLLSTGHNNFMLVTGPNMGGKTVLLKQIGIIQIMAQIGCYVPAEKANIKIMSRIVARSGSSDDERSNCSSFMWEMRGIASALESKDSTLYLIDEVGRGTSIDDGASYSFAIAEELALRRHSFTVFATHFDQVFALETLYNNVKAYHFEYDEDDMKISHLLVPGLAEKSHYGLRLAEACGLPDEILRVARAM